MAVLEVDDRGQEQAQGCGLGDELGLDLEGERAAVHLLFIGVGPHHDAVRIQAWLEANDRIAQSLGEAATHRIGEIGDRQADDRGNAIVEHTRSDLGVAIQRVRRLEILRVQQPCQITQHALLQALERHHPLLAALEAAPLLKHHDAVQKLLLLFGQTRERLEVFGHEPRRAPLLDIEQLLEGDSLLIVEDLEQPGFVLVESPGGHTLVVREPIQERRL